MVTRLSASLQNGNMHISPVIAVRVQDYAYAMETTAKFKDEAIRAVADWAKRISTMTGWAPSRWASEAGVSDTTVTRGLSGRGGSTPKLENLHALAVAAKVPSVLDFLKSEAASQPPRPWLPKPETIADLLAVAMHVDADDHERLLELQDYAHAVCTGLQWLAEDPETENDPGALKMVRKRVAETIAAAHSASSKVA